jgi:EAL domain-containing protein (putative c-di-GMP-specific phosphodiesterase class I)
VATAQRITTGLNRAYLLDQHGEAKVGVSIGIACAPAHADGPEALLSFADKALYAAKSAGLGVPRLYDDHLKNARAATSAPSPSRKKRQESSGLQTLRDAANMANDLRVAMHAGHLHLHYQPIYDAGTRRVVVCEALSRWTDPVRGAISPREFIPVAEDSGLIGPLTEWVLLKACEEAAKWVEPIQVSVNLSPLNLSQPSLVATVARILADTGLAPQRLVLELTEGSALEKSDAVRKSLNGLKELGVELWIDDFGVGHANIAYLQQLSCNVVKIDSSFLQLHDKRRELLRGMISLTQECGLRVVVEGVETPEHDELLRELGCDLLQGFLLGRPMPAEQLGAAVWPHRLEAVAQGPRRERPRKYDMPLLRS